MNKDSSSKPDLSKIHRRQKPIYSRVVGFFIKDLYNFEKMGDKYFIVRNYKFSHVLLCGNIVSKKVHRNKLSLEVHDGTKHIRCLLDPTILKSKSDPHLCEVEEKFPISHSFIELHSRALKEDDLIPGIIGSSKIIIHSIVLMLYLQVLVEGRLSDYGGVLYVFVDKIMQRSVEQYLEYLHKKMKFYQDNLNVTFNI